MIWRGDNGFILRDKTDHEVYKMLFDVYRLRMEDGAADRGKISGLYAGEDSAAGFTKFLEKAEAKGAILPGGWKDEKRAACEGMGSAATGRSGLYRKVSKTDIQEYCGEYTPIELRMLEAWVLKNGSMKSE